MKSKLAPLFIFVLFFVCEKAHSLEGLMAGISLGRAELETSGSAQAAAYGFHAIARLSRGVDILTEFQTSRHREQGGYSRISQIVSAEFRPWVTDSIELNLCTGFGGYYFSNGVDSSLSLGINVGAAIDVVIQKYLRVGPVARVHWVNPSSIGSDFHSIMLRVGYYFPL